MKTPHTLCRPLPGIEPVTYRSLWSSKSRWEFYIVMHPGRGRWGGGGGGGGGGCRGVGGGGGRGRGGGYLVLDA